MTQLLFAHQGRCAHTRTNTKTTLHSTSHTACVHIGDVWGGETQQPRAISCKIRIEQVALSLLMGFYNQKKKNQSGDMDFTMSWKHLE